MKACIVSHGEIRDYEYIRSIVESCDLIVCADGGAEHVIKCGLLPDVVIGDLDSIEKNILEKLINSKCRVIQHPRDKDYTDTQLAINYAIEAGAIDIILLGCTGDRLDHSLANIFILFKLIEFDINVRIINEKNTVYIIKDEIKLKGSIGDLISLLPIGGDVGGIYTKGLKYKLEGKNIAMGDPLGISNVFISEDIEINIKSGYLLVIKAKD
jgi:thiamine pyrophosphokinase